MQKCALSTRTDTMLRLGTWEGDEDMGRDREQGCQMVIMCQELFHSRLSIEMTGSRTDAATNLNWMA